MSQIQPLASQGLVRANIQRAAARTSVDFNYLLGQANMESRLNPSARSPNSSASGLYQFISSTWLDTVQKHGAKHGLGWASSQIEQTGAGPVVRDPAMRAQILGLRFDPEVSSLMAGEFAADNGDALRAATGREPNNTDLYLAHFLGPAGASEFLRSLQTNPDVSAASLFPRAAGANRSIFFDGAESRSLGQVYALLQSKMDTAIGRGPSDDTGYAGGQWAIGEIQPGLLPDPGQFTAPAPATQTRTTSTDTGRPQGMAELLRTTFAVDGDDNSPASANVRKAYDVLRSFNL